MYKGKTKLQIYKTISLVKSTKKKIEVYVLKRTPLFEWTIEAQKISIS